jgi:hypothetical protein
MPQLMPTPPRLSIVIPTVDDTAALEETLVSVLENRPDDCEIVVVLACDYADPWNIRDEVRFVKAPARAGLVSCINLGIAASAGQVIHILTAGWRATAGWTDRPLEKLASGVAGAVAPLAAADATRSQTLPTGVRCTRGGRRVAAAAKPMAPALEVGFWRADVLDMVGGSFSDACGDAGADADMAVALARLGCPVVTEPAAVVVRGPQRRRQAAFLAGLHAERLFWRSAGGRPLVPALCLHLVEVLRHAFVRGPLGTVPMLAGRLVALLQFGSYRQRYQQLRRLAEAATTDANRATIRIDAAHAAVSRPTVVDRDAPPAPLRRSA